MWGITEDLEQTFPRPHLLLLLAAQHWLRVPRGRAQPMDNVAVDQGDEQGREQEEEEEGEQNEVALGQRPVEVHGAGVLEMRRLFGLSNGWN